MRLASLVLAGLLASAGLASAAKSATPYAAETTAAVRALRDRQRTTAVSVLGAMRSVRRVAQTTGSNQSVELGHGLTIKTVGIAGGKFGVSVDLRGNTVVASSQGRLPTGHMTIGQRLLRVAPELVTADVDGAIADFLRDVH